MSDDKQDIGVPIESDTDIDEKPPVFEEVVGDDQPKVELKEGEAEVDTVVPVETVEPEYDPKKDSAIILAHTLAEVQSALKNLKDVLTKDEYNEALGSQTSQLTAYRKLVENTSTADNLARKTLASNSKELQSKYMRDDIRLMDVTPVSNLDKKGATVTGQEAIDIIRAKNKNLRKVYLYNSGFYLIIKGPSLDDLNAYFNSVSMDTYEYGREFGAYFYMFSDLVIKEAGLSLIKKLVVYANVKNFKKDDNLAKAISIHDYDVIMWAISTLMYKNGFPYTYTCINNCTYTETTLINLKTLRMNNYTKLSSECINFINENVVRNHTELANYRKNASTSEIEKIHLYDQWYVTPKVPTLYDFIKYGELFNASLIENVHLDNQDTIYRYIQYNFYKVFVPWIDELRLYNEDGSINVKTMELKAITECLDTTQLEESEFGDKMDDYITSTNITNIVIPFTHCPLCKYVPTYVKDGYIAFDVQKYFFSLLVMRLAQTF